MSQGGFQKIINGIVLHRMGKYQFWFPSLELKGKKRYVRCLFSITSLDNESLSTQTLTAIKPDLLIGLPRSYFFL